MAALKRVLVYFVIFLICFSHTRGVAPEGFSEFQTPTNFNKNFGKIYYKYIPSCSCVCFELSFKASESQTLLITPCGALNFVKISRKSLFVI